MTALERAQRVAVELLSRPTSDVLHLLADIIFQHIIEHSKAELNRRRVLEEKLWEAGAAIRILLANVEPAGTDWGDSETVRLAKEALKALEGDQPVSTLPDGIWRCSCCGERKPDTTDASWRWNGQGWEHAHGQAGHFEAARSFGGGDE